MNRRFFHAEQRRQERIEHMRYERSMQASALESAEQVVVAEVVSLERDPINPSVSSILVVPRRWIKGQGTADPVRLSNHINDCTNDEEGAAVGAHIGKRFVLLAKSGPITRQTLNVVFDRDSAVNATIVRALEAEF
jgi:hypothetical protein